MTKNNPPPDRQRSTRKKPRSSDHRVGKVPPQLTQRLTRLRDGLLHGLVERDVAVRLALLGTLAGEHLLLIGPPGTAKSLIARRLHLAFADSTYFERLLTRFTVPEELFGPLSIKGLEEDRYERLTACYLPKASIAFLDEIFKANSAILNALLTLLNEREFDNGTRRESTPLLAVIGASNELPEGEELDALFDRFLLRLHVGPVSSEAFPKLLRLRAKTEPKFNSVKPLTQAEIAAVRKSSVQVGVPSDVIALLSDLRSWCQAEEIPVSDRRWLKIVNILQVSALTNGRSKVSVWDCWLLQHCLWSKPEDREALYDWYASRVGTSAAMDPSRSTKVVVSWEAQLAADRESRSQARDPQGRLLFKGQDGKPTTATTEPRQVTRDGQVLYLTPTNRFDYYGNNQAVSDRTNGGKGHTLKELEQLQVKETRGYVERFNRWEGRDAYLAESSNWLMTDHKLQPMMEPTRQKASHIQSCLSSINERRSEVVEYQTKLDAHITSLKEEIHSHLWVTDDFAAPAAASLAKTRREVASLVDRIDALMKGFKMLPRENPAEPLSFSTRPRKKTTGSRKKWGQHR